ncbi:hypothetical protein ITJ44_15530 [Clavibacter sp. VKM Ac-2873]|uniref:hypothetical protein n=1 Tax=Clavibacter sp. VKM Ac-2873 TaxID=2783813 RepID=UPI00188D28D2|nr:hypothetical protein [Clavibacter sp. VKM Ac-2873]MBF4619488.1 hypothetical protein [Clavibacter sp. VKM Ac-2873]
MTSMRPRRSFFSTIAIGAVTSLGLVIVAPGSSAFAVTDPTSPGARVGRALDSGHFIDDIESGAITEADVVQSAATGIDLHGQHVDNWMDLSPQQVAEGDALTAQLHASMDADPQMAASLESTKAAIVDSAASYAMPPAAGAADRRFMESKRWYRHLIHWYTIYINHDWLRGLLGVGIGAATVAICSFFSITGVACAFIGVLFAGGLADVVKNDASCSGKGLYVKIPDTVHSHCER